MVLAAPAPVATPLPRDVDRAVPVAGRGELVLEVAACAVGRTDLQQVEGETIPRRLPIVPGTRSSAAWTGSQSLGRRTAHRRLPAGHHLRDAAGRAGPDAADGIVAGLALIGLGADLWQKART